jgi:hypothetical protein
MDTKSTQVHFIFKNPRISHWKTESSKPVDLQNPRISLVENIQLKKPVDIHSPRARIVEDRKLKSS